MTIKNAFSFMARNISNKEDRKLVEQRGRYEEVVGRLLLDHARKDPLDVLDAIRSCEKQSEAITERMVKS